MHLNFDTNAKTVWLTEDDGGGTFKELSACADATP